MIIFLEGLPRSGKSYSAVVQYIIPALQKGRAVYAYIEGLNHQRISEAAELPLETVEKLLYQITREQVPKIYEHVENDSLVVIDELANFWPTGRSQLPQEVAIFIKEHGHRGLDLLVMDQVMADSHKMWTGRVDTKLAFLKRDAVGKPDEYITSIFKRDSGGKLKEVTKDEPHKYDPKYFGTYKSHTDGTANTETFSDKRTNIWNSKSARTIKYYALALVVAVGFIIWFFATAGGMGQPKKPDTAQGKPFDAQAVAEAQNKKAAAPQGATLPPEKNSPGDVFSGTPNDLIDDLSTKNRIRLAGVVRGRMNVVLIEWRDSSNRVIDRLTGAEISGLGWYVMISIDGGIATITKPGKSYVATQWPIVDDRGGIPERVPDSMQSQIKPVAYAPTNPAPLYPGMMGSPSSDSSSPVAPVEQSRPPIVPQDSQFRFKG